jgi:holo-[acyl-carrier protein] synthase/beta-N-acetylhexosaminidase
VGTDVCDIRRISKALERHGERFALKILSSSEMKTFRARSARFPERGVRFLATRFSVKEAFSKAVGLGMRMPMWWTRCEVVKLSSGQPTLNLKGDLLEWFNKKGLIAHVSLSDETDYATSFVIVEKKSD